MGHSDFNSVPTRDCDIVTLSIFFFSGLCSHGWETDVRRMYLSLLQVPLACPQYLKLIEFKLAQGAFLQRHFLNRSHHFLNSALAVCGSFPRLLPVVFVFLWCGYQVSSPLLRM